MADITHYIGLMSGTSLDVVDAVLARFDASGTPVVLSRSEQTFPPELRSEFLRLNQSGQDELVRSSLAANELAHLYAKAVDSALNAADLKHHQINAIGAHGQTVRHQPSRGYTIQLNAPALLAELTQIDVIADFRSRDIAAGGQGAPLVPFFHAGIFKSERPRVILNLGGIANITVLYPGRSPVGFDTGPANVLMDGWIHKHNGQLFDRNGNWGATGKANLDLLTHLIKSEPWFSLPAPKSTGRDLFDLNWLESRLAQFQNNHHATDRMSANDVQATLCGLTAQTVAMAIDQYAPDTADLLVCGGGAQNDLLLKELRNRLNCPVDTTNTVGIGTQDVEALAFAWLAWAHQRHIPVSHPAVTGARGSRILGATWPA